jgi:hypothetical protein
VLDSSWTAFLCGGIPCSQGIGETNKSRIIVISIMKDTSNSFKFIQRLLDHFSIILNLRLRTNLFYFSNTFLSENLQLYFTVNFTSDFVKNSVHFWY